MDDGSADDTEAVCVSFADRLPIRYVFNNRPSVENCCQARNCALRLVSYDDLIVSEPELLFDTDVIAQFVQARQENPDSVLCAEYCWGERYEGADEYDLLPGGYVNCYRREWLMSIQGWDEALPAPTGYDDNDIYARLVFAGHPQVKWPGVIATHQWHYDNTPEQVTDNENRLIVEAKVFPQDLVANQNREWGVLLP